VTSGGIGGLGALKEGRGFLVKVGITTI
jgi:hypothetical protein